jgi:hypothetical protein
MPSWLLLFADSTRCVLYYQHLTSKSVDVEWAYRRSVGSISEITLDETQGIPAFTSTYQIPHYFIFMHFHYLHFSFPLVLSSTGLSCCI